MDLKKVKIQPSKKSKDSKSVFNRKRCKIAAKRGDFQNVVYVVSECVCIFNIVYYFTGFTLLKANKV